MREDYSTSLLHLASGFRRTSKVYLKKCNLYQIHGGCPVFYIQYTQFIYYLEIFQEKKRLFLPFHFAEALAKTRRLLWQMSGFTGTYKSKKGGNK